MKRITSTFFVYQLRVISMLWIIPLIVGCNTDKTSKHTQTDIEATKVTFVNWEDTLAYSLGVRYYQEKSTGYSLSLNEYLKKQMVKMYGNENYSEYFQSISQIGASDAEKGSSILPLSFVRTYLNLVDCENNILKSEKEIDIEENSDKANRLKISMNNEYKRIQFILRNHPAFPYSFTRIDNYQDKRDSILALPTEMFVMPKTSNPSTVPQSEVIQKKIGNWTLKDNHYESPIIRDEYGDGCKIKFILSKGKIEILFSERIETEYEMKLIVNGNEHTITGSRNGKIFTITSSNEISTILAVLDRGNFTFQYMFLDPGASHWGWSDYPIISQLKQVSEAYSVINH